MNKKMRKGIIQIGIIYTGMFVILISYLSYFVIVKSKSIVIHTHNRRMDPIENEVLRGDILSSDGVLIATTIIDDETTIRKYPQNRTYSHAVGYTQKGKTGIEAFANVELLRANYTIESILKKTFDGVRFQGRDIVLTIDSRLQQVAENALGDQKGAVIILESSTGKIKALVSKPDFNPNTVGNNWESLISDSANSPLVNRAFSGLYPPGSIFKIVTAKAFFDINGSQADLDYTCMGEITVDDNKIRCFNQNVHGDENLMSAFTHSCNTYFVNMGGEIGAEKLRQTGEKLLFNKTLPISMEHSKSQLIMNLQLPKDKASINSQLPKDKASINSQLSKDKANINLQLPKDKVSINSQLPKGKVISDLQVTKSELAATSIGQGKTLVTPIHMAMLASSIANEGILMKPYIIDYSKDKVGHVKTKNLPEYVDQIMSSEEAKRFEKMMIKVVENGTGGKAYLEGMYSGGKTGTAQNETDKDHSWFVGFTGKQSPDISMAIIIENAGKDASASTIAYKNNKEYKNLN